VLRLIVMLLIVFGMNACYWFGHVANEGTNRYIFLATWSSGWGGVLSRCAIVFVDGFHILYLPFIVFFACFLLSAVYVLLIRRSRCGRYILPFPRHIFPFCYLFPIWSILKILKLLLTGSFLLNIATGFCWAVQESVSGVFLTAY